MSPEDRIGPVLRYQGCLSEQGFAGNQDYILDVELWHPGEDLQSIFLHRLEATLSQLNGAIISEYTGRTMTLARVRGNGNAIRAVLNLPEVATVDEPPFPDIVPVNVPSLTIEDLPAPVSPPIESPIIGIIDSGITSEHPYLKSAIIRSFGVPTTIGENDEKGHGTAVAAIAIYGDLRARIETQGELVPQFKLASARVVDSNGHFDDVRLVPTIMEEAIRGLYDLGCKVINISLGQAGTTVALKPSPWAAVLDELARELHLLIIVTAGNSDNLSGRYGERVVDDYPNYLKEDGNRLLEPASAINVIVVGSLSHSNGLDLSDEDYVAVQPISGLGKPSPFTRCGPGVAASIKPDLSDYGGTAVWDGVAQRIVDGTVRDSAGVLTLHHRPIGGQLFCSRSGTSFAAPLVAYKAAMLQEVFPKASANFLKALLALAADHPEESSELFNGADEWAIYNLCGYGVSDIERASSSEDSRVTLYAEEVLQIDSFAVFEIPIPREFQTTKGCR